MKLYGYYRSSAAYRVRIALNLKGIAHSHVPVNLLHSEQKDEEYNALNPQGLVPTLRLESGECIGQSTAILEYLESEYPDIPLLPAKAIEAAKVRAWANTIACDIHPLNNLRVQKYITGELDASEAQKIDWLYHWIDQGFSALEQEILAAPYCFGESLTLADVYLIPQVYNALRFKQDLSAYPKIMSVYEACNCEAAFAAAAPEQQADAV